MELDGRALKQRLGSWGADLVGFGDVREELAPELSRLPVAVSIGIHHDPADARVFYKGTLELVEHQDPAVDYRLSLIQKRLTRELRAAGKRFFVIPPDSEVRGEGRFAAALYPKFPHKRAATCAGLGWIGKSGLLITSRFGPRASLATVLTDASLPVATPVTSSRCGSCDACLKACPVGAIRGGTWSRGGRLDAHLDVGSCRAHVVENHAICGRYICGACAAACPVGSTRGGITTGARVGGGA